MKRALRVIAGLLILANIAVSAAIVYYFVVQPGDPVSALLALDVVLFLLMWFVGVRLDSPLHNGGRWKFYTGEFRPIVQSRLLLQVVWFWMATITLLACVAIGVYTATFYPMTTTILSVASAMTAVTAIGLGLRRRRARKARAKAFADGEMIRDYSDLKLERKLDSKKK